MIVSEISSIESFVQKVSSEVFRDFCDGMGIMFDIDIRWTGQEMSTAKFDSLKEQFNKQAAMYSIEAKGRIDGTFYLVLDHPGVFTLPGIIVMHPKKRIEENCRKGTDDEVTPILDAVKELGNLLVGSWQKIVQQQLADNTHLLQTGTYAGSLSDIPEDWCKIPADEEFTFMPFEITVGDYSPFVCGVMVSSSLLSVTPES